MMRINKSLLIAILSSQLIIGCHSGVLDRRRMTRFFRSEIILPEQMTLIQDGKVSCCHPDDSGLVFVMYHGIDECYKCVIKNLEEHIELFDLCDSLGNVIPMLIISVESEDITEAINIALEKGYPFPLYIDDYWFRTDLNPYLSDTRFRYFLMSDQHKPVFVGNPILGEKLKKLFIKSVCLHNN